MVRGDLVAHATVDTDEIEYRDVGDLILSNLNEAIKDKEK